LQQQRQKNRSIAATPPPLSHLSVFGRKSSSAPAPHTGPCSSRHRHKCTSNPRGGEQQDFHLSHAVSTLCRLKIIVRYSATAQLYAQTTISRGAQWAKSTFNVRLSRSDAAAIQVKKNSTPSTLFRRQ